MTRERLGPIADQVDRVDAELTADGVATRIWAGDHTVWQDDPTEVADRLGWLHVGPELAAEAGDIDGFAAEVRAEGCTDAVIMGMGGSSLFPEVVTRDLAPAGSGLRLHVIDTTDPAAVRRIFAGLDPARTLHVASSKSGTTVETRCLLDFAWDRHPDGAGFAAITDGGSDLDRLAAQRGFRRTFRNRADIGGRFSALSHFGMVPAALAGAPWTGLLAAASRMADRLRLVDGSNPGVRLGAVLGAGARAGRDKVTLVLAPEIATFGLWLEQLLAESTGKGGAGVLPVSDEPLGSPDVYGADRLFVALGVTDQAQLHALDALAVAGHPVVEIELDEPTDLGAEVMRWEFATAVAGRVLGVNPFDQPNVAEAKTNTNRVLEVGVPDLDVVPAADLLDRAGPGDYVAILAFVDPTDERVATLEAARRAIRDSRGVATTVGIGPRYLHSTGQFHKGGPPSGVFLVVVDDNRPHVPVPDHPYDFATLIDAQAAGDLMTLRHRGLRAGRVSFDDLAGLA